MMKLFIGILFAFQLAYAAGETAAAPIASTETSTQVQSARLSEDQIPLQIEGVKKAGEAPSGTGKAIFTLLILTCMLVVGFYGVRRYKTSNSIHKSNTRIKVLSQHYLGPKKSLAIIHVAGESILIGVTEQNISMIKSLSLIDDEVPENLPNNFGQTLAQTSVKSGASGAAQTALPASGAVSQNAAADAYELDEEFSFANVTDTVSKKIKSMRSIS